MGETNHSARQTERISAEAVPHLPNFLTQVLYAVELLQRRCRGVCMPDIVNYMKEKFKITGDVRSRVETSVAKAQSSGFLHKDNDRYTTLPPAARLQKAISMEKRKGIVKQLQEVFIEPSLRESQSRRLRRALTSSEDDQQGEGEDTEDTDQTTKESVRNFLRLFEEILMEEESETDEESTDSSSDSLPSANETEREDHEENGCAGDGNTKEGTKRRVKKRKKEKKKKGPTAKKSRRQ